MDASPPPDDLLHQVGAFEPHEARRVCSAFEAADIPFEVEADHSSLATPGRWFLLNMGVYPEGSKLAIFVPTSHLTPAQTLLFKLFPV